MSDVDTRALVERAQAGDTEAFGEIYRRYNDRVLRTIWGRVGHRQTAEDLAQDVFVRAYRNLGSFTWREDIGAWLTIIARNIVFDHFKSHHNRHSITVGDDNVVFQRTDGDRRGDPPTVAIADDSTAAVGRALADLVPAQRRCLALRFGAGLPEKDAARELGITVGAVKSLQYRAIGALRRSPHLEHLGGER